MKYLQWKHTRLDGKESSVRAEKRSTRGARSRGRWNGTVTGVVGRRSRGASGGLTFLCDHIGKWFWSQEVFLGACARVLASSQIMSISVDFLGRALVRVWLDYILPVYNRARYKPITTVWVGATMCGGGESLAVSSRCTGEHHLCGCTEGLLTSCLRATGS